MRNMRKILAASSLLLLLCGAAWGDLVYTTSAADYSSGTVGAITGSAGARTVTPAVVPNLKSDLILFSFTNGGAQRLLLDEHDYAANDRIWAYGPETWTAPIANESWSNTKNAHAFAVANGRLYAGAYDSANVVAYSMDESKTVPGPYTSTGHFYNFPAATANHEAHVEGLVPSGGGLWALVNYSDSMGSTYMDSKLVELSPTLDATGGEFELTDVRNASGIVALGTGRFAIAYRGGMQKLGTKGGVFTLTVETGEVVEIAGGSSGVDVGAVESICSDGAGGLWIVGQEYKWSGDWDDTYIEPSTTLYRWDGTSVSKEHDISGTAGSAYSVRRDEADGTVAVVAGDKILLRDASGNWETFGSSQLGGWPTSVAFFKASKGSEEEENGSGGGGCSAAGLGALALAFPLFLIRRKGR